jgi:hypothetical protein
VPRRPAATLAASPFRRRRRSIPSPRHPLAHQDTSVTWTGQYIAGHNFRRLDLRVEHPPGPSGIPPGAHSPSCGQPLSMRSRTTPRTHGDVRRSIQPDHNGVVGQILSNVTDVHVKRIPVPSVATRRSEWNVVVTIAPTRSRKSRIRKAGPEKVCIVPSNGTCRCVRGARREKANGRTFDGWRVMGGAWRGEDREPIVETNPPHLGGR